MKKQEPAQPNPEYISVVNQLSAIREQSELHLLDVAVRTGLEIEEIQKVEAGDPNVPLDHFVKYVSLLGYDLRLNPAGQ